jgi:hypothetical protein
MKRSSSPSRIPELALTIGGESCRIQQELPALFAILDGHDHC